MVKEDKKAQNNRYPHFSHFSSFSILPQLVHLRLKPEGALNNVEGKWEVIDMAVDSGATDSVLNEDMLCSVETKPGPASRRGVKYEVANGEEIPNLGEKRFAAVSEEGTRRNLIVQVCDVSKALLSVRKMVAAGNRVVFDGDGSYVEDKVTKEKNVA